MFGGLLKCPKASVEVAWDPRLPWPRYSRKLTFSILGPSHYVLARILDSIGLSPGLVRWSRCVAKTLYPRGERPRECIAETGFGFSGFSVYAWNSFENTGRQILVFSMTVS